MVHSKVKKLPLLRETTTWKTWKVVNFWVGSANRVPPKKRVVVVVVVVVSHVIKTEAIFYFISFIWLWCIMMLWILFIISDSLLPWHPKIFATEQLLGGSAAGTSSKTSQVSGRALLLQTCDTWGLPVGAMPGKTQPDPSLYGIWWIEASGSNILWGTPPANF